MKLIYTAEVTVHGGRAGEAQSSDGHLVVHLSRPKKALNGKLSLRRA